MKLFTGGADISQKILNDQYCCLLSNLKAKYMQYMLMELVSSVHYGNKKHLTPKSNQCWIARWVTISYYTRVKWISSTGKKEGKLKVWSIS